MQIPVLSGIYTDGAADFRTSYPVNMVPVPKQQGISNGYLRPADGIVPLGTGPGVDRGGINWNGVCYRVMGTKLVSVASDGTVAIIGDVGNGGQATLDYSFDHLAIASGGNLFLYDGVTLQQNVDADLGTVLDVVWVDGYFMTTDGTFLVVTELGNPFAVDPLKYGSSEVDPDPVKGVLKVRDEIYALNRHTIEVFDNVGPPGFPFQRVDGAQIQKGTIGTHTACVFGDAVAFLGGGHNEPPAIYVGANGQAAKISTREIDQLLLEYSESELEDAVVEAKVGKGHEHLLVHLPDRTIVYDAAVSQALGEHVWFQVTSSVNGFSKYRGRNCVWCYDKWVCGDPTSSNIGEMTNEVSSHYGEIVRWEFGTVILYNESRGAVFHELELVSLTGRTAFGDDPQISTSYSLDGETWSQDKTIRAGKIGDRLKRLVWFQQGHMRNWRIQRFRGDSQAFLSVARLEAQIEPLSV